MSGTITKSSKVRKFTRNLHKAPKNVLIWVKRKGKMGSYAAMIDDNGNIGIAMLGKIVDPSTISGWADSPAGAGMSKSYKANILSKCKMALSTEVLNIQTLPVNIIPCDIDSIGAVIKEISNQIKALDTQRSNLISKLMKTASDVEKRLTAIQTAVSIL